MADKWTSQELRASVETYIWMLNQERQGKSYVKAEVIRQCMLRIPDRSFKSIEYRMQNISSVLDDLGEDWIKGFKPMRNVGANVYPIIKESLIEIMELSQNVENGDFQDNQGVIEPVQLDTREAKSLGIEHSSSVEADSIRSDFEDLNDNSLPELFEMVLRISRLYPYEDLEDLLEKQKDLIKEKIPNLLLSFSEDLCEVLRIPEEDLLVQGGGYRGDPSPVPYVMFGDRRFTAGASKGRYCVYLFGCGGSSLYLSLNQGTTTESFFSGGRGGDTVDDRDLADFASWARSVVYEMWGDKIAGGSYYLTDQIDLRFPDKGPGSRSRARSYEPANALAIEYGQGQIPSMEKIKKDAVVFGSFLRGVYDQIEAGFDPLDLLNDVDPFDPSPEIPADQRDSDVYGIPYTRADEDPSISGSGEMKRNLKKQERGLRGHNVTQNIVSEWVLEQGFERRKASSKHANYDVAWFDGDNVFHVCEVKSLTNTNEETQMRKGLGQVLRYRQKCGPETVAVLAIERQPSDQSWLELCAELDVRVVWPGSFDQLETSSGKR